MKMPRDLMAGLGLSFVAHGFLFWPGSGVQHADAAFDQGLTAVRITLVPSRASVEHLAVPETQPDPEIPAEERREPPVEQERPEPVTDVPAPEEVPTVAVVPSGMLPTPVYADSEERPPADRADTARPKAPEQDGRLEKKGVNTTAKISGVCRPVYPRLSRKLEEEGAVSLLVNVDSDGRADSVRVAKSSGYRGLDNSALKALTQATFIPARRMGIKVDSVRAFEFTFKLEDRASRP